MIKVLVADDHTMFVDGIESILKNENDIEIVGRAYDGKAVLDIASHQQFNIVLLDVNLPILNGLEVCKELQKSYPFIKVLAISMFNKR